jgi:hypothetical protein
LQTVSISFLNTIHPYIFHAIDPHHKITQTSQSSLTFISTTQNTHMQSAQFLLTLFRDLAENSQEVGRAGIILLLLSSAGDGISTERRDRDDGNGTAGESAGGGVPDLSNPHRCAWVSGGSGEVVEVSGRIQRGRWGFQPDSAKTSSRLFWVGAQLTGW